MPDGNEEPRATDYPKSRSSSQFYVVPAPDEGGHHSAIDLAILYLSFSMLSYGYSIYQGSPQALTHTLHLSRWLRLCEMHPALISMCVTNAHD
jgi:hypothetical protein